MPNTFPSWAGPTSSQTSPHLLFSTPRQPHNKILHISAQNIYRNLNRLLNHVDINSSHIWLLTEMAPVQVEDFQNKLRTQYPNWTLHWHPEYRTAVLVHPSIKHQLISHTDHLCTVQLTNSDTYITCMYGSNVSTERSTIICELKSLLDKHPHHIVGGDLNAVEDPEADTEGMKQPKKLVWKELNQATPGRHLPCLASQGAPVHSSPWSARLRQQE